MKLHGPAFKFGDFINTDVHASSKYFPADFSPEEVRKNIFSELHPGFVKALRHGGFIVAGKAFGTVSSRVDSAVNIKAVGVGAVLAESFGMLFFRNAINTGLPCITCDTGLINDADQLEIDLEKGLIKNNTSGAGLEFQPFPPMITRLLDDGGLLAHIKKNKGYAL